MNRGPTLPTQRRHPGADRSRWLFSLVAAFFLFLTGIALVAAFQITPPQPAEEVGKDTCLTCHGPFDQLAEKTKDFQTPAGETLTPHRHIPHDTLTDEAIPECLKCHQPQPHPIPPEEKDIAAAKAREKPNLELCYSCHHIREFISCKTCHQGKGG